MDDQNKNLILAIVLSGIVMLVWLVFFAPPPPVDDPNATPIASQGQTAPADSAATGIVAPADSGGETSAADVGTSTPTEDAPRVNIDTPRLSGSISLRGGRIDDLALRDYRETLDPGSDVVTLMKPEGQPGAYYSVHGWAPGGDLQLADVPNANTLWSVDGNDTLKPDAPVTLVWENDRGVTFRREVSVDEDYLFTITQTVENASDAAVRMAPYGILARHGEPEDLKGFFIIHEGAIRMADGELTETDYDDMTDLDRNDREAALASVTEVEENGWIGFTDHYWMTTLIPSSDQAFTAKELYRPGPDLYLTEARMPTVTVEPGATQSVQTQMFAGAKEWETIRNYENKNGITGFLDSIDWGWFFFLTKPIFWMLHTLNGFIGNMGWSIIGLTLIIKAILLPLAYKSYVSMARMKELQPEMEALKERAGDDKQKLQKEMMMLYKEKKVNPAAGCLPILMQIPIFFSLYKVIFVTLELRHAEWIGWIRDLSAPDPSSILNLFGLLPFTPPEPGSLLAIISLGVLPIILGISMWLQQKLNPAPTDPTQKMIFAWMPWIFMFMLGSFASGLVLYWIANNTITFIQQYAIMRSQGYKPDVFGNITSGFKRDKPEADK